MSRRQSITVAAVLVVLLALLGALWWWWLAASSAEGPPSTRPVATSTKSPPAKPKVTLARDMNWSEATEEDLRDFTALFGSKTVPTSFQMEVQVESGETLLADAYEARPGEFVFTKLTPTRKQRPDGSWVIEVELSSFSISLAGEPRDVMNRTFDLQPLGIYSNVALTEHGNYQVTSDAESGYESGPIHLRVQGAYKKHARPLPSGNAQGGAEP